MLSETRRVIAWANYSSSPRYTFCLLIHTHLIHPFSHFSSPTSYTFYPFLITYLVHLLPLAVQRLAQHDLSCDVMDLKGVMVSQQVWPEPVPYGAIDSNVGVFGVHGDDGRAQRGVLRGRSHRNG